MTGRDLVVYHANCSDGWCSAWLLDRCLGGVELLPAQYGDPPPDGIDGRTVFVVDFSYSRADMLRMNQYAHRLVVLDHHKTAEAECSDLPFCTFDMTKSGARLTYEWLDMNNMLLAGTDERTILSGMPILVDYVEDRDLWLWKQKSSRYINAAIKSMPFDLLAWDELAKRMHLTPQSLAVEGTAIERYRKILIDSHVSHAREINIDGYKVMAVECTTGDIISEVVGTLAEDAPFAASWFQKEDGDYVFSLRSRAEGLDVSEIAKHFGGGGHPRAAGFKVSAKVLLEVSPDYGPRFAISADSLPGKKS